MKHKKTLLLAVIVYFVTMSIGILNAEELEEAVLDTGIIMRDPFVSMLDKKDIKYPEKKKLSAEIPLFPMNLTGLMLQEGNSVAIINEDIIKEGQFWRDFQVERIDEQGVTLSYMGKDVKIEMEDGSEAQ